jgi:sRNA-binding regulator protein Hfq
MADVATSLKQLAEDRFDQDIWPAEQRLFEATASGKDADCADLPEKERVIRADRISWLCTNPEAFACVTHRGLSITGAKIDGNVDLAWAKIPFRISATTCVFSGTVDVRRGDITFLNLGGSSVNQLNANTAHFGGVFLRNGFKAEGGVNLGSAQIDGTFDCNGGQFIGKGEALALDANSAKVKGGVYLRRVKVEGGVNLVSAQIDGNLDCDGGQFIGKDKALALNANSAKVKSSVFLRNGFKAEGGVNLVGAYIDGNLECGGSQFIGDDKVLALDASGATVKGGLYLRGGFKAEGGVKLVRAKIDGDLDCSGGEFISKTGTPALDANGVEVKGAVSMRNGFKADGGVKLLAAKIGSNLSCIGGEFTSKTKTPALDTNSAKIEGNVLLRDGFKAEGGVNLVIAKIAGNLECDGGYFVGNERVPALNADGAKIDGSVYLRKGFKAEGRIVFFNTNVGSNFQLRDVQSPEGATISLRYAKVGTLLNDKNSWPREPNLEVDGFSYDQIGDRAFPNAKVQLGWLQRQPRDKFLPQPYEQLAAVLGKMGLEEDAKKVMIAKNEEHRRHLRAPMGRQRFWDWVSFVFEWFWYKGLGRTIGYGYHPWNAFLISLVVIGIGWSAFAVGYHSKLITPTGDKAYVVEKDGTRRFKKDGKTPQVSPDYPKFNAFVYSLETFLPLVKFGIGERWAPNANLGTAGSVLRYYLWIHITAGWVLTTLWLGGLTRLLKT